MIDTPQKNNEQKPSEELVKRLKSVQDQFTLENLLTHVDASEKPQEDFFRYMNGTWLNEFPIPEDKSSYGTFMEMRDKTLEQTKACLNHLLSSDKLDAEGQKIVDLYQSYMDTQTLNRLGIKPIEPFLDKIAKVDSIESLATLMADLHWIGVQLPFSVGVSIDSKQEDAYTLIVGQSGLGMPGRDYYLSDEGKYPHYREAYQHYVQSIFQVIGKDEYDAKSMIALETQIAQIQWPKAQCRDPQKTYNLYELGSMPQTVGDQFPWQTFFEASQCHDVKTCVVRQPDFLKEFDKLFAQTPLNVWKDYLAYKCISHFAPYLSENLSQLNFDFYSYTLQGIAQSTPRDEKALKLIDQVLGEAMGRQYVQRYFPESSKQRLLTMIELVKEAFAEGIEHNTWMNSSTKEKALEKLEAMRIKIGYPEKWLSYDAITIQPDTLIDNLISASSVESVREMEKLTQKVNKDEWLMLPHTVNAYNLPVQNEICFPAGILQAPFFDPKASDAQNFGAIGAIIGHEISHGFDDQGRKYDAKGQLTDWWTSDDANAFEQRVEGLVNQYNAFEPIEGAHVDGRLTLGENIADLTGLTMAYQAYKKLHKQDKEKFEGDVDPKKVLFMSWGSAWRSCEREDALRTKLATDPHSPGQYRCNAVLSHLPSFYKKFGVQEGDAMYLPEEKRVGLWF